MRREILVGLGVLALTFGAASASPMPGQTSSAPDGGHLPIEGVITRPDWVAMPNGNDLSSHYPLMAQMLALQGRAVITCTVNRLGMLIDCTVVSETPAGIGFGEAALAMAPLFRMKPETQDGEAVGGAKITVPIRFVAPEPTLPDVTPAGAPTSPEALVLGRRLAALIENDAAMNSRIDLFISQERTEVSGAGLSTQQGLALDALGQAMKANNDARRELVAKRYAANFPQKELAAMVAFFASPAGQDWTLRSAALAKDFASDEGSLWTATRNDARARLCAQIACLAADPTPPAH